jgi:hypothetical protein
VVIGPDTRTRAAGAAQAEVSADALGDRVRALIARQGRRASTTAKAAAAAWR